MKKVRKNWTSTWLRPDGGTTLARIASAYTDLGAAMVGLAASKGVLTPPNLCILARVLQFPHFRRKSKKKPDLDLAPPRWRGRSGADCVGICQSWGSDGWVACLERYSYATQPVHINPTINRRRAKIVDASSICASFAIFPFANGFWLSRRCLLISRNAIRNVCCFGQSATSPSNRLPLLLKRDSLGSKRDFSYSTCQPSCQPQA